MSKKGFKRLIEQKHRELMQEMWLAHQYYTDSTSSAKKESKNKLQDSKGKKVKPSKNKRPQARRSTQKRK